MRSRDATTPPAAPGFWWLVLLSGPWFLAGFLGAMYFSPDSNLAPAIGVLISGPAGVIAGLFLFFVFRLIPAPAALQWTFLGLLSVAGTAATLLFVQPEPKAIGSIVEVEVQRIRPVSQAAPEIMDHWRKRYAQSTRPPTSPDWEQTTAAALAADSRVILEGVKLRSRVVLMGRAPWDRGQLTATPWGAWNDSVIYSPAPGTVPPDLAPGTRLLLRTGLLPEDRKRFAPWPPRHDPVPYEYVLPLPPEFEQFR
jgi:hypothetical protein